MNHPALSTTIIMSQLYKIDTSPQLPYLLAIPFRLLPVIIHSKILAATLNKVLSQQIKDGDIDFLNKLSLCINVKDAGIRFIISFSDRRLVAMNSETVPDITIQASTYDFLSIAARQEDPDTLMFQRRLIMQGNTELGLELKNFLDGLEIETSSSLSIIDSLLQKSFPAYRKLFS